MDDYSFQMTGNVCFFGIVSLSCQPIDKNILTLIYSIYCIQINPVTSYVSGLRS